MFRFIKLRKFLTLFLFVFQSLEKNAPGNKNAKNLNVEDSENAKEKEVIDPMVTPASAKKSNKEKEPKQTQPPKIHFEDGEGVKGKDDEPIDNEESENVDVDENKEEKGKFRQ